MATQAGQKVIDASPTKDLFIDMLVKDIRLIPAIIDLIDNAVDGARRMRPDENYKGLWVRIEATKESFRISDNCGGISVDLAANYVFRFGRPEDTPPVTHSVGEFGVGMKRAIFKLGKRFVIESTTEDSHFVVDVSVEEWRREAEWQFAFKELEEGLSVRSPDQRGTSITVDSLHEGVSNNFQLENFKILLRSEIEREHQVSLSKGLVITLDKIPVGVRQVELLHSNQLKPAFTESEFVAEHEAPVTVKIYAGISKSIPQEAGWYVFCNGRMVLGADQTFVTGWGEGGDTTIPRYHPEYARFRGYIFFDSDDAGRLPWNTTKTGVDEDSPLFRYARLEMIRLMRPVINFLNKLHDEKGAVETDDTPLNDAVEEAKSSKLGDVSVSPGFVTPKPKPKPAKRPPKTARIQYFKPLEEIDRVKEVLKVSTYVAVGEKTFEYFYALECAE